MGLPIAILAVVGLLVGLFLWSRSERRGGAEAGDGVELPAKGEAAGGGAYGDVLDVRESRYDAADSPLQI